MANPPGYFKEYYRKKGKTINRRRRRRYNNDEEYRDRVLQASSDYRDKKREERMHLVKVPRYKTPRLFDVDGEQFELYSIGYFSHLLGRSVQSIVHWETTKPHAVLPVTPYRDVRKFRYYTYDMMMAVVDVVGDNKRLMSMDKKQYKDMYEEIKRRWMKLGVPVDKKIRKINKNTLISALRESNFV